MEFHCEAQLEEWKAYMEEEMRRNWNEWCKNIYTTMMCELKVSFARERAEMEKKILTERQSIMREVEQMMARKSEDEGMRMKRSEERKLEENQNERKEMERKMTEQHQEEGIGQNTEAFEIQENMDQWKRSFETEMLSNWTDWSDVVLRNIRAEFERGIKSEREKMEERLLCERQTIIQAAEIMIAGKAETDMKDREETDLSRQAMSEEEDNKQEMWEEVSEEEGPSRQVRREENITEAIWEEESEEEYSWMENTEEAEKKYITRKQFFSWNNWRKLKGEDDKAEKKLEKRRKWAKKEEEKAQKGQKKWEKIGQEAKKTVDKVEKKKEEERMKAEKKEEKANKKLEKKKKKENEPSCWELYQGNAYTYYNFMYL